MSGFSFKLSKSKETVRLAPSVVLDNTANGSDETEVTVINGDFETVKKKPKKEELVIPLITKNRWRVDDVRAADPVAAEMAETEESELEKAAKAALLADAKSAEEKEGEGEASTSGAIPLLYANQVPSGFETDEKLDVRLRAEEPDEADYDSVPIGDYGMAMLRGMGWKEGEGIGRTHKAAVTAKIPELRPKGLGLGADKALVEALKRTKTAAKALLKENTSKDDKTLRPGAFVKIRGRGAHNGAYGKVSSVDSDGCRVLVKLALGGSTASVSLLGVVVVGEKEYEKEGKCINKAKFDRYKADQAKAHANHRVEEDPLLIEELGVDEKKGRDKKRKQRNQDSPEVVEVKRAALSPWLRPDLRVRVVDETHPAHLQQVSGVSESATGRNSDIDTATDLEPVIWELKPLLTGPKGRETGLELGKYLHDRLPNTKVQSTVRGVDEDLASSRDTAKVLRKGRDNAPASQTGVSELPWHRPTDIPSLVFPQEVAKWMPAPMPMQPQHVSSLLLYRRQAQEVKEKRRRDYDAATSKAHPQSHSSKHSSKHSATEDSDKAPDKTPDNKPNSHKSA